MIAIDSNGAGGLKRVGLGVAATLSIALGLGCIDLSAIQATSGTGGRGAMQVGTGGVAGRDGGVGATDASQDVSTACKATPFSQRLGESCSCNDDCLIGSSCVEGICCSSPCASGCQTCTAQGLAGVCVPRSAGASPRNASDCPVDAPSSCGTDGTCDGAGSCHRYLGTTCLGGVCEGDAVIGTHVCDGTGHCQPSAATTICVPYSCDSAMGACVQSCTFDEQCSSGHSCDVSAASCGKKGAAAACRSNADCLSNFCSDGTCCNVACQGPCVACNLSGQVGTCQAIGAGAPDPRGLCLDQGPASCGHDGTCDGLGSCANYPQNTICSATSCTGNQLTTAGVCDGLGTCQPPTQLDCSPFLCANGTCTGSCTRDADCVSGHACVNGSCGLKLNGNACSGAAECASNHCVDGVCCDSTCTGACRSCALAGTPGRCQAVAAGSSDPRGQCSDQAPASCGTNGKCDGSGSCQKYAVGTPCADESCTANVYTPPSTCAATGQCVAPDSLPCFPFTCNGRKCFATCANDQQCTPPSVCILGSCGLKSNGAACASGSECLSTFCAQGNCCNAACSGPCQSCALFNAPGTCTNVPVNAADPAEKCQDQASPTCGTNGKCDGAGACQLVGGVACPAN